MYIYIYYDRYIFLDLLLKYTRESVTKMVQNRVQNGPKSFKIEVWGSLGALWDPSWRPSGAGATTRAQKVEKCKIFGSPKEPKMEQKAMQNHVKNCMIFYIGFGMTFS